MRFIFVVIFLFSITANANMIWGRKGHRVIGHLAEKHLTRKAKRAINELLDGHSLAFASTYADEIKSDNAFRAYFNWHFVNYPLDRTYTESTKDERGDIITAIETCKRYLTDKNATRGDKVFHLKFLIHLIGDLHQPLHAGRAEDRGGNDIQVQWFGQGSNIHRVWDTNMLETYGMSYYELGDELNRITKKKERKRLQEGTVVDWLEESHVLAADIYGSVQVGEKLGYDYGYEFNPVLFERLRKGGFRLARILNEIFD
ncbi:S1/P1 nuclease [Croceivirga thetidis]|uniref:S1/P1 nuclease n=1 Tax=Croceivirga thetidis TaxID=2721623 RepID=A0ABX1GU18_9FLAO|nr:S1/P1 nuclease [Croceivirga thetidis]NKI33452.1 S1/P1 nuclease [Croceivirga thetidis]